MVHTDSRALLLLLALGAACRSHEKPPIAVGPVATVADTTALLGQMSDERNGVKFEIQRLATYRLGDWQQPFPFLVTILQVGGPGVVRGLGFATGRDGKTVQFYDSGYLAPGECGGLTFSVPEVRSLFLTGRPLVVVVERRNYEGCEDPSVADTSTALFFDGSLDFRRVLTLNERIVKSVAVEEDHGDTTSYSPTAQAFRFTYYTPNVCRATCENLSIQTIASEGNYGPIVSWYEWNADTTQLVGHQ